MSPAGGMVAKSLPSQGRVAESQVRFSPDGGSHPRSLSSEEGEPESYAVRCPAYQPVKGRGKRRTHRQCARELRHKLTRARIQYTTGTRYAYTAVRVDSRRCGSAVSHQPIEGSYFEETGCMRGGYRSWRSLAIIPILLLALGLSACNLSLS